MQPYTDFTSGARFEHELPRPVEIISAREAARTFVREYEPGTIAHALHQMFMEADQRAAMGIIDMPLPRYAETVLPNRAEAYRDFLATMEERQFASDAVKKIRTALKSDQPEISENDVAMVGEIYNRNFFRTLHEFESKISPRDFTQLKESGRPQATWKLRDMVTSRLQLLSEHWGQLPELDGANVLRSEARSLGCMIGDVQFLDSRSTDQVVAMLRHAGTEQTQEQWKSDVQEIRNATYRSDYDQINSALKLAA